MGDSPATTIASVLEAVAPPPDRSPYRVYLARLAHGSRPALADALATIARMASGGRLGPEALPPGTSSATSTRRRSGSGSWRRFPSAPGSP